MRDCLCIVGSVVVEIMSTDPAYINRLGSCACYDLLASIAIGMNMPLATQSKLADACDSLEESNRLLTAKNLDYLEAKLAAQQASEAKSTFLGTVRYCFCDDLHTAYVSSLKPTQ